MHDDIVTNARLFIHRGRDILRMVPGFPQQPKNQLTTIMIQATPHYTSLYLPSRPCQLVLSASDTPSFSRLPAFREGASDKEFHTAIEAHDEGWIVTFAYGKRGGTLTTGVKTDAPLPLETALRIFEQLVASKLDKGYRLGPAGRPAPV